MSSCNPKLVAKLVAKTKIARKKTKIARKKEKACKQKTKKADETKT